MAKRQVLLDNEHRDVETLELYSAFDELDLSHAQWMLGFLQHNKGFTVTKVGTNYVFRLDIIVPKRERTGTKGG